MFDDINYDTEDNSCEYAAIDTCHEIDRNSLDLVERLGSGQFGDVYRGTYKKVCFFFKYILFKFYKYYLYLREMTL